MEKAKLREITKSMKKHGGELGIIFIKGLNSGIGIQCGTSLSTKLIGTKKLGKVIELRKVS